MNPKKKNYGNTGEMFEETLSELYGTPESSDEDDDEDDKDEDDS